MCKVNHLSLFSRLYHERHSRVTWAHGKVQLQSSIQCMCNEEENALRRRLVVSCAKERELLSLTNEMHRSILLSSPS